MLLMLDFLYTLVLLNARAILLVKISIGDSGLVRSTDEQLPVRRCGHLGAGEALIGR